MGGSWPRARPPGSRGHLSPLTLPRGRVLAALPCAPAPRPYTSRCSEGHTLPAPPPGPPSPLSLHTRPPCSASPLGLLAALNDWLWFQGISIHIGSSDPLKTLVCQRSQRGPCGEKRGLRAGGTAGVRVGVQPAPNSVPALPSVSPTSVSRSPPCCADKGLSLGGTWLRDAHF